MKKTDMMTILNNYKREELPTLMEIENENSLLYNIPYVERIVRSSDYYDIWRTYLKYYEDASIDSIENLDTSQHDKVKIEIHHVITLFDICYIVGLYLLDKYKTITPYDIASEVLKDHLLGNIIYLPLLITSHQKLHSGLLKIPKDKHKGNKEEFINKYKKHMTKEQIELIK